MTEAQSSMFIITDPFQLAVLSTLASMPEEHYGINIHGHVAELFDYYVGLDMVYEALIELAEHDRIVTKYSNENDPRSRKIFHLNLPDGMTLWGPNHPDYSSAPSDWDKGVVLYLSGEIIPTYGVDNAFAWNYDDIHDGTDIIGYTALAQEEEDGAETHES